MKTEWYTNAAVSIFSEEAGKYGHPEAMDAKESSLVQLSSDALQFAFSVFEGMRVVRDENRFLIFRAEDHYVRLRDSCEALRLPAPSYEIFIESITKTLVSNRFDLKDRVYIRPLVIATSGSIMAMQHQNFALVVLGANHHVSHDGIALYIETANRRTIDQFKTVKTATNYCAAGIATTEAQTRGASSVLWVGGDGNIQECTTMNIFFVIDRVVHTPALGSILPGITRKTVIELLNHRGIDIVERDIAFSDLSRWMEDGSLTYAFTTSTALGIRAVKRFHRDGSTHDYAAPFPDILADLMRDYDALSSPTVLQDTNQMCRSSIVARSAIGIL